MQSKETPAVAEDALTVLEFVPVPEALFPPGWREALAEQGCTVARRERSGGAIDYLVLRGAARIRFRVLAEHAPAQALLNAGFLTRQLLWLLERQGLVRVRRTGRTWGVPPAPEPAAPQRAARRRLRHPGRMRA